MDEVLKEILTELKAIRQLLEPCTFVPEDSDGIKDYCKSIPNPFLAVSHG